MKYRIIIAIVCYLLMTVKISTGTIDPGKKISLQFEGVPVSTVLNMIADQHHLNIVQSSQIDNEISIRLDNVSLADALDAILTSNGYNFFYKGDIIVVKPLDMSVPGELQINTVELNYISPAAAVNAVTGILSPRGNISIIENPESDKNSDIEPLATKVVIMDLPGIVKRAVDLIAEIDIPQVQIAIEVKMIETNIDNEDKIGLSWPTSLSARLHGISTVSSTSTTTSTDNVEAMGQIQLPDGKWQWGKLSLEETGIVLDFLEQRGNSKLISDPHITTLDNHEAEIKVTTIVPIQTINRFSEGGSVQDIVTFQDEEIGITLKVTPHICGDRQIILDVKPTVAEIIGYSGSTDNQKPITSQRSVSAKITVGHGETAALGGLMKEDRIETEKRLFLLGSLPILGNLFRHKSVETSTTELMILITPTIIGE